MKALTLPELRELRVRALLGQLIEPEVLVRVVEQLEDALINSIVSERAPNARAHVA